jgi:hypothetical protein
MRVTFVTQADCPFDTYAAWRPVECVGARAEFNYTRADVSTFNAGYYWERNIYIHTAKMRELSPDCHYEYRVGYTDYWSDLYYFAGLTPEYKAPYTQSKLSTSLLVIGDWGTGPVGENTMILLDKTAKLRNFDGVLHLGDIAYDLQDFNGLSGDLFGRIK